VLIDIHQNGANLATQWLHRVKVHIAPGRAGCGPAILVAGYTDDDDPGDWAAFAQSWKALTRHWPGFFMPAMKGGVATK